MSSMTKYLKQRAVVKHVLKDTQGNPILDIYGQPSFDAGVTYKCRIEEYRSSASTGYGQFKNYRTTYYFDDSAVVSIGDKVDGELVQRVHSYVNGLGSLVGYEVSV